MNKSKKQSTKMFKVIELDAKKRKHDVLICSSAFTFIILVVGGILFLNDKIESQVYCNNSFSCSLLGIASMTLTLLIVLGIYLIGYVIYSLFLPRYKRIEVKK